MIIAIVIGFKLGHMMIPRSGNIKAVLWSEKSLYIHAFNPDEEMEKEVKNVRKLADIEDSDSIKRILDFGVRQVSKPFSFIVCKGNCRRLCRGFS